jgi:hypothetical protein
MSAKTTKDILQKTKDMLKATELGLDDVVKGDPNRRASGLRNVVVFGRSVTNILQNLRSTESSFDDWYGKYREEMRKDELMRYMYELRSIILKEGELQTSSSVYIRKLNTNDVSRFPRPPNAIGFFVGDGLGGSGWKVKMPDGSIERYYVDLPKETCMVNLNFRNAPKIHRGKDIDDKRVQHICSLYVTYLRDMVNDAYRVFGNKEASSGV